MGFANSVILWNGSVRSGRLGSVRLPSGRRAIRKRFRSSDSSNYVLSLVSGVFLSFTGSLECDVRKPIKVAICRTPSYSIHYYYHRYPAEELPLCWGWRTIITTRSSVNTPTRKGGRRDRWTIYNVELSKGRQLECDAGGIWINIPMAKTLKLWHLLIVCESGLFEVRIEEHQFHSKNGGWWCNNN